MLLTVLGITESKGREKTRRVLLLSQNSPQIPTITPEQGFSTEYTRLSSASACVCDGRRRPLEASGRTGTEQHTELLGQEGSVKASTLTL